MSDPYEAEGRRQARWLAIGTLMGFLTGAALMMLLAGGCSTVDKLRGNVERVGTIYDIVTNAASTSSVSTGNATTVLYIGTANSTIYKFQGHIGEIIIYSKHLTADETTATEKYLKRKWGLP